MIKGSMVELTTPSDANGAINYDALEQLVDWHVHQGSAALLVGSLRTSSLKLDTEERTELFRRAVWQADGRIPVIADISGNEVSEALENAGAARAASPDAVMLSVSALGGFSKAEFLRDLASIAAAAALPTIVRGHQDGPLPKLVNDLARIDGVVGYVEAAGDPNRARELLALHLPVGFALYSGQDIDAYRFMLDGFSGSVSVIANVAPAQIKALSDAALSRDRGAAEALSTKLQGLKAALLDDPNSIAIKWALTEIGSLGEGTLPPTLAQPADYSQLRRAMRAAGIGI